MRKKKTGNAAVAVATKTETAPAVPDDPVALDIAIKERGENLAKLIEAILRTADARARAQVVATLCLLADGTHYLDATAVTGVNMQQVCAWRRFHPIFSKLWYASEEAGEDVRRAKRLYLAHKHAVEGTEKPVFQGGVQVGVVREFDHKLLQWLIEADNPGKYRDQGASINIANNVQSIVVEMHRG